MKMLLFLILSPAYLTGLDALGLKVFREQHSFGVDMTPSLYFDHKFGSYYLANIILVENIPASLCREGKVRVTIWIGGVYGSSSEWFQLAVIDPGDTVQYSANGQLCHFETPLKLRHTDESPLNPMLNTMTAVLRFLNSANEILPITSEPVTPRHPSMQDTVQMYRERTPQWSMMEWETSDLAQLSGEQQFLVAAVNGALAKAMQNESKATQLRRGFGGYSFQHFMNNLGSIPGVRYLEVGTYNGTSLFSFLEGNLQSLGRAVAVDSWEQGNVPYYLGSLRDIRDSVMEAIQEHGLNLKLTVIEKNCWDVTASEVINALGGKAHIYFYDAGHSALDHYIAIPHFLSAVEDTFVLIVDDWSWSRVRRGTYSALQSLPIEIVARLNVDTILSFPEFNSQWHNGVGVFVLRKISL